MIDFHNHLLYDVDDGPKTIDESIEMCICAHKQGITEIVQTVHFQHPKMEGKNVNYDFLMKRLNDVQAEIDKRRLNIKLHLTAEVFYLPNLLNICKNPLLTIGNNKYMLIEFSSNIFPEGYENQFFDLQSYGVTPIIAHPERYRFIQNDVQILNSWIDRGYVIQIDAGSIIGHFGKNTKNIAQQIINNGHFHLIGSDAHNSKKRNFCIHEAYDILQKILSSKIVNQLKVNSESIIQGEDVFSINYYFNSKNSTNKLYKLKEKLIKFLS